MSDEIKSVVEAGLKSVEQKLDSAIEKVNGQVAENGKASADALNEVKSLSEDFKRISDRLQDIEQKGVKLQDKPRILTFGQQFTQSESFKNFASGGAARARIEIKNTILGDEGGPGGITPVQQPNRVVSRGEVPLGIRDILPRGVTTANAIAGIREVSTVNNAAETAEGALKPESDIVLGEYTVPIRTIATVIKLSKQIMDDAPAVASYIDNKLRYFVNERIEKQLVIGNGTAPNISGLLDTGNFTAYTATAGDTLVDAVNRAKYAMWAAGYRPDAVVVNPADWGAMERTRADAGAGAYLYGMPGQSAQMNAFGVEVVLSAYVPAGTFLIGAFRVATMLWEREGVTVEAFEQDEDNVQRNLVTVRAEARLGLEVSMPSAIYSGAFTA
jgi:HK97 family phage major capsid protein